MTIRQTHAPRTLKTRRYELFATAGYITSAGRRDILKLCAAVRQRQWLEGLRYWSKTFSLLIRSRRRSPPRRS